MTAIFRTASAAARRAPLVASLGLSAVCFLSACGSPSAESDGARASTSADSDVATSISEPSRSAVAVRVLLLEPESVTERLELPADLEPARRASLASEVAGAVEFIGAREGDWVAAGRVLARIDRRSFDQAVAEAEAFEFQTSKQLERAKNLFEKRSITQAQLLDAVTNQNVAAARLASAKLQLDKSTLNAPWSGQVAVRRAEVGDYAVPGQSLFELVDTRVLKVRAPVPASQARYVAVGRQVEIRVDGFGDQTLPGKVVRMAAELDAKARTLDLEAEVPNRDGVLRPGMLGVVLLPLRVFENALLVPLATVQDLENGKAVYIVEDGQAHRRTVTLGPILGDRVILESGVSAGDQVIVQGQQQVGEGQLVEVVDGSEEGGAAR